MRQSRMSGSVGGRGRQLPRSTRQVKVLADAFEYRDQRYRSLSKIAREITGSSWNGYLFFELTPHRRRAAR